MRGQEAGITGTDIQARVQDYLQAFEDRELQRCMSFFTDDASIAFVSSVYEGKQDIEKWHRDRFAAGVRFLRLDGISQEGDRVSVEGAATSRKIKAWKLGSLAGSVIFTLKQDKIAAMEFSLRRRGLGTSRHDSGRRWYDDGRRQIRSVLSRVYGRRSPGIPRHLRQILSCEGDVSPSECQLLYELSSQVLEGCIVEIGSWRGRSTVALALAAKRHNQAPVYAVDPHEPFVGVLGTSFGPKDRAEFFRNMLRCQVSEVVRLVNLSSEEASKGWARKVALLWIDGDHRHEAVRNDFDWWHPHVVKGGLLVLHDSTHPDLGPFKVVADAVASGKWQLERQVDTTTVLRKLT